MIRFIFIAALLVCYGCAAQPVPDSAHLHLKRVDNNAVHMVHNDFPVDSFSIDAAFLYKNANQYIIDELTMLLANEHQALASHVLLTKLLEPGYKNVEYTTEEITDKILISYKYNGFKWKEVYDKINLTTEIRVDPAEIKKINAYWMSKNERTNDFRPCRTKLL